MDRIENPLPDPRTLALREDPHTSVARDDAVEDRELMRRLLADDAAAFGVMYDRHVRSVYGLAYRMLRDRTAAEDVAQEAFVALWRNRGSYAPARGTPVAWLLTITRNRAIDAIRRGRGHRERRSTASTSRRRPSAPTRRRCAGSRPAPSASRWARCRPHSGWCSSWGTSAGSATARSPRGCRSPSAPSRGGCGSGWTSSPAGWTRRPPRSTESPGRRSSSLGRTVARPATLIAAALAAALAAGCGAADDPPPKPKPPVKLRVSSPSDTALVLGSTVQVSGSVSPSTARVQVQGRSAQVSGGRFRSEVSLEPGPNVIDVAATARNRSAGADRVPRHARAARDRPGPRRRRASTTPSARSRAAASSLERERGGGFLDPLVPKGLGVCEQEPRRGHRGAARHDGPRRRRARLLSRAQPLRRDGDQPDPRLRRGRGRRRTRSGPRSRRRPRGSTR